MATSKMMIGPASSEVLVHSELGLVDEYPLGIRVVSLQENLAPAAPKQPIRKQPATFAASVANGNPRGPIANTSP